MPNEPAQSGQNQQGTSQSQGQQPQAQGQGQPAPGQRAGAGTMPLADLNRIVLEFLNKKGYSRTEAMLRIESSRAPTPSGLTTGTNGQNNNVANRPIPARSIPRLRDDPAAYYRAYALLKDWTENSLDLYRPELRRICYPVFVHMFLDLVAKNNSTEAKKFFEEFSVDHEILHGQDIEMLSAISLPNHLEEKDLAKTFRKNKYRVTVSRTAFDLLLYFLQEVESNGGSIVIRILNQHIDTRISTKQPSRYDTEMSLDPNEGLPGLNSNGQDDQVDKFNSQPVKLGAMPVDPDFDKEVTAALEQKDEQNKSSTPQGENAKPLSEEYQKMKEKAAGAEEDAPTRDTLPLPPPKSIDVQMEIRNIAESKNKITIGTGPQAAMPSVCMYTFHNTHDDLNCLSFSDNSEYIAGGFSDSFVKVWSVKGNKLKSVLKSDEESQSKRLVGHAGAVFGTSFSPDNRYLLSCSEDKTVRLWSMDTYTGLVSYKGHNHPVWDVEFSPFGHYFATASHDQTARLWSCDHIYPLRIFAGHLSDVDCVSFHPNGTYVITGSSDKTCRMWDISKGNSVRVFMGHTQAVNCTAVSPDGRWMASGCEDGIINVWDLGSGRKLKQMRGHGKAFIYSLAFSRDGSVLVSAGADNSVRVWDIKRGTQDSGPEPEPFNTSSGVDSTGTGASSGAGTGTGAGAGSGSGSGSSSGAAAGGANNSSSSGSSANGTAGANGSSAGSSDKDGIRKKEIVATSDHMAVFYTKKTPVYNVHFTRRNLCLAAGAFVG